MLLQEISHLSSFFIIFSINNGLISIDESRDNQSEIQKITDKYIALIETKLSEKEKEILKVW